MEVESELEDEVDQLDSESDADASELDISTKNGGSGGQRMPGHSLIPALRLENIIQADGKFCPYIFHTFCSSSIQVLPEISLCRRRAYLFFQSPQRVIHI